MKTGLNLIEFTSSINKYIVTYNLIASTLKDRGITEQEYGDAMKEAGYYNTRLGTNVCNGFYGKGSSNTIESLSDKIDEIVSIINKRK